jgi:2-furoyl-CoA dehydrogenase large subunit
MSTPVCIANAVADALGVAELDLPLTPAKLAALTLPEEPAAPQGIARSNAGKSGERTMHGTGEARVEAKPEAVWAMLLDANVLASIIPGTHGVQQLSPTHFRADVMLGVGPVRGRYKADISLSDLDMPCAITLSGSVVGTLGSGDGIGRITLAPDGDGTHIGYTYEAAIGGRVAAVGGRLLEGAARVIIDQFFAALARKAGGRPARRGLFARLLALLAFHR